MERTEGLCTQVRILEPDACRQSHSAAASAGARRINRSLTASGERKLLQWLARRAPAFVTSDQLTVIGFLSQCSAGVAFAFAREHRPLLLLVVVFVVLNWLGDSLDGTLARVRNLQRPRFGFYVDHMVDVFGSLALLTGLSMSGFVHGAVAAAMLIGFLLLASESFLASYTLSRFELSQGLFGPTELRLLLIAGTLALLRSPYATVLGHRMLLFDLGGSFATICMFVLAVVLTVRHTVELYREEPLP